MIRKWFIIGILGLLTLFSFFGLGTVTRNVDWKDEVSLWKDTVKKSPNKARPHNNFGLALKIDGIPEKAKIHYFLFAIVARKTSVRLHLSRQNLSEKPS
jgi:hypothetical protein